MGRVAAATSRIYVDEHNFSGRTNKASIEIDNVLPKVTCFGDSWDEFVEAIHKGKFPVSGFFDPADDNYDEEMFTDLSGKHYLGVYPGNDASHGDIGFETEARIEGDARPHEIEGAVLLNVTWKGDGPVVRATVLANEAVTGSGVITNSNKNLGATAAGEQFVAVVRCLAFNGTTLTVDIEESSDDGGGDAYALISGMQQVITGVGCWRLSTASATEAYKRVNITAFTGTSMTLLIVAGKEQGVS